MKSSSNEGNVRLGLLMNRTYLGFSILMSRQQGQRLGRRPYPR